jgi:PKD repeat protein
MMKTKNPHKRRGEVLPYLSFAFLLLFCQQLLANTLQNGVAQTSLASTTANLNFTLDVPAGSTNLSFAMSGGTGDADLYVRFGSAPTSSSYDCRPYQSGNNETCTIANVQAGTYYVMLDPYSAFSGVSLMANFTEADNGGGDPGDGGGSGSSLNESNLSGAQGSSAFFSLDVPAGATNLAFNMSGGSGDADLYVRFGAQPTTSTYDCRPYQSGNNEACPIANAQAGTYYVMLRGYSAYSGVSLTGTYNGGTDPGNTSPEAIIANGPFSALVGESIAFSSAGSNDPDGSIASYSWNFGNGTTSTQANPSRSYAAAGTFTVTLTVTDNEGATDSASSTVTITNPANTSPNAVIANGPFSADEGEAIAFSSAGSNDPDGSIASYSWNFGDGASSAQANPSHSYSSAGNYTVTLTVTDNQGASASDSESVTITAISNPGEQLNESNLSGASGSSQYFTLNVPAGATNLLFAMSGGSGDADLYVRFGAQPTTSAYDCRPYQGGNNESCPISPAQAGTYHVMIRGYSAYSGVTLTGTYDGGTPGGNIAPEAVIANGPFSAVEGQSIAFSSAGSNDPDGSIASYSWNFGDGSASSAANPSHSYQNAGTYTVTLTVTDNDGAGSQASSVASISVADSGFVVSSHYYDKGSFDYNYTNYDAAFSDNYSDTDVEIHSYIVVNFNESVRASTINSNAITVKRLNMADTAENKQNIITGTFELVSSTQAIFKPDVEYYMNEGGVFDWNNPNWNGLKPNYQYSVQLASSIKNTAGESLAQNENASWEFQTIDNDYGLYWFKDGFTAMKYVPGRPVPLEFYNPNKPTHIYGHGWAKTSVHLQEGQLRDYRREPMTMRPGSMYPSQEAVDMVDIWKDPSKNYEGKAWNFGIVYWNQFADDDYANLSKPQMAEAKIWSTDGRNDMSYAIRKWNGSSWSQDHVETNAPMKPVTVILADALISAIDNANVGGLRFSGNSLGNQIITGMSYILKKEYAEGRVSANLFPSRIALLDPYWRDGALQDSWTTNHPAYVDLGAANDSAGDMTFKIVKDLIEFADNDPNVSFVGEYYDTSRTTDGSFFGQAFGDRNQQQRDIMAIIYQQASWIAGNEGDRNYYGHRHVYGRYWYQWTYAFAPPATGFSASSSDAVIRNNMNYYKSTKIRYSISAGGNTPSPVDDNYSLISGSSWQQ